MNRIGPNTDPWYTTTLTSNSSLKKVFTHDLLLAPTYMACNILPNHSSTPRWRTHHSTFRGTLLQAFFKLSKCHVQFPVFCKIVLLKLHKNKNCICCTRLRQKPNCISSMLTVPLMMFLTTLSINFRT